MDLSSVLKSPLFVCLHWSETACLVLGSCGESRRDCFHKVFKIGTKLSFWLLCWHMDVCSKQDLTSKFWRNSIWSWRTMYWNYFHFNNYAIIMQWSYFGKNAYFICPQNCWKVFKLLVRDFLLLFWHRKSGEKSPACLSTFLLVVHCNRKKI